LFYLLEDLGQVDQILVKTLEQPQDLGFALSADCRAREDHPDEFRAELQGGQFSVGSMA
jgi:hypothetical protein